MITILSTLALELEGKTVGAAQEILDRQYADQMTKQEAESFKIAFVVFIMSTLLAPSSKHDCTNTDYWAGWLAGWLLLLLQVFFMEQFYLIDRRLQRCRELKIAYSQKSSADLIWCYDDDASESTSA
ncbi:hypothetical protein ACP70R_004665 [Stipagrostis hirtigluma subsp. patula]